MSLCVGWGGGCGERRQERKYCHPDRYIKITGDYIIVKGVSFRYEEHGGLNFMNFMLTPNGRDLAHSCLVKRI